MLKTILNVLKQKSPVNPSLSPEEVRQYAVQAAKKARVGGGHFGQVYAVSPGTVVKEIENESKQKLLNEINLQAQAAEMGIAPTIQEVGLGPLQAFGKTFPLEEGPNPRMRGEIEMQDLRENYVPLGVNIGDPMAHYRSPEFTGGPPPGKLIANNPALTQTQINKARLDTHKQLAQLALKNINLTDRHSENIFVHKMTGRPMQIDFGLAEQIKTPQQKAAVLSLHVANGFKSAGLEEEASIFLATTSSLLEQNPNMALDVAKQGLSRLQKIKSSNL
jgi:hypothetical protein